MPNCRLVLLIGLTSLMGHQALASCTAEEARNKREIAWDHASLVEMRDLPKGRELHARILAMQLSRETVGSNVDWDHVCAQYDEIANAR